MASCDTRTSAFQFKQKHLRNVLTRSIRRSGNQLRISVGLEDALNSYPGKPRDHCGLRETSIRSKIPFTMADSAQPGCRREDSTSNVFIPNAESSGI